MMEHTIKVYTPSILTMRAVSSATLALQTNAVQSNMIIMKVDSTTATLSSLSNGYATNAVDGKTTSVTFTMPAAANHDGNLVFLR
ncbi:MAG: hypothetical protein WDN67_02775 [Candidatus Moraniibacteriota bacterium]